MTFYWTEEIERAHRGYWFSKGAKRFFKSRIGERVYGGRYFVTSEEGPSGVRAYSVREYNAEADTVSTVGEFQGYATRARAHAAAKWLGEGK